MSIGWMFLGLALAWLAFLVMLVITLRQWLAEDVGPELDWDEFADEPRLVSTCRDLCELAAKTKEASHG
ncbi:hypothetical protein GRF56_11810 [Aeromonas veronii]|uniref:hypothetical protein n=1 Tax=Aeromonas veronii TaxID=654 RepID=UPI001317E59B|nr:hypothetical protein [Aeromonas veronii]QHC08048.1 hypothetical protein GRF56_11810 [Aeromonas veronii]